MDQRHLPVCQATTPNNGQNHVLLCACVLHFVKWICVARENIVTPTDDLRKLRLYGNDRLAFAAGPNEVGRLDMFASDPPVTGARIYLLATDTLELPPRLPSIKPVRPIPDSLSIQSSRKLGQRRTASLFLQKVPTWVGLLRNLCPTPLSLR